MGDRHIPGNCARRIGTFLLAGLLSACGEGDPAPGRTSAQAPTGDGAVEVRVAGDVRNIEVVRQSLRRPAGSHAAEVSLVLRNSAVTKQTVRLQGDWLDGAGRNYGGFSSTYHVPATGEIVATSATRTRAVSRVRVRLMAPAQELPAWAEGLLAASTAGAVGGGVAFTETPSLAEVPAWEPRGLANGVPFEARTILFVPESTGWQLQLVDVAFDPLATVLSVRESHPDVQTVYINLPEEPYVGMRIEHGLDFGGAMFQIRPQPTAETTTSWNTRFALALEISDWQRKPWQPDGETYQIGGRASGRIYIVFAAGMGDIRNSFVAGEFADAPIVYYGPPRPPSEVESHRE